MSFGLENFRIPVDFGMVNSENPELHRDKQEGQSGMDGQAHGLGDRNEYSSIETQLT